MNCQEITEQITTISQKNAEMNNLMDRGRTSDAHNLFIEVKKLVYEVAPNWEKAQRVDSINTTTEYGRSLGFGANLVNTGQDVIAYYVTQTTPDLQEEDDHRNVIFLVAPSGNFASRRDIKLQDFDSPGGDQDLIFAAAYDGNNHLAISGASDKLSLVNIERGDTISRSTDYVSGNTQRLDCIDDWIFVNRGGSFLCFKQDEKGLVVEKNDMEPNIQFGIGGVASNVVRIGEHQYAYVQSSFNPPNSDMRCTTNLYYVFPETDDSDQYLHRTLGETREPVHDIVRIDDRIYFSHGSAIDVITDDYGEWELQPYTSDDPTVDTTKYFSKMIALPNHKIAAAQEDGTITIYDLKTQKPIRTIECDDGRIIDLVYLNGQLYSSHKGGVINKWGNK